MSVEAVSITCEYSAQILDPGEVQLVTGPSVAVLGL